MLPPKQRQPRAPLAMAAAAFACGIWLAGHLQRPPALWGWTTTLLVLCSVAAVLARSTRPAQLSAVLALLCAGAFARIAMPAHRMIVPPAEFLETKDVEIVGHVTNDGMLLTSARARERFDLETEYIELYGAKFSVPFGVRVTLYSGAFGENSGPNPTEFPGVQYGDRIGLKAKLRLPRNFHNSGAFDYESYLRGIGISVLASAKAESMERLPGESGTRLGFWRSRIRRS